MKYKLATGSIILNLNFLFVVLTLCCFNAFSQVNMITGQSTHQIEYSQNVVLRYDSDIDSKVRTPNEIASSGWCGLGWKLGYPSIFVIHNNTVDNDDDRWFLDDGYGNFSEIIRTYKSALGGDFYIKSSPFQKVKMYDNNPAEGQLRIIKGWEITNVDGTISRFGFIPGQGEDMQPYLPCWGNYIGRGKSAFPAPGKFYHRWPLREIESINKKKTIVTYSNITGYTAGGFSYTQESYPHQILTPDGGTTTFVLDDKDKSTNEKHSEPSTEDFDFLETKYLRSIVFKDITNKVVEQVNLTFSGDPGQISHLKSSKTGFAERLLTGITTVKRKDNTQLYSYDMTTGQLLKVFKPAQGSTVTYNYSTRDIDINSEFTTGFSTVADDRNVLPIGNHVFCQKYVNRVVGDAYRTFLEFEIYSKVGLEWQKQEILGYTSTLLPSEARLYPYNDRFILVLKNTDLSAAVLLYEWIDNAWVNVHTHTAPCFETAERFSRYLHGPDYFLEYYPKDRGVEFLVYGKQKHVETWSLLKTLAYTSAQVKWDDIDGVSAAKEYFVFGHHFVPVNEQMEQRTVRVIRKNLTGWNDIGETKVEFKEAVTDYKLEAFDDFFVASNSRNAQEDQHVAIRRWNPILEVFEAEIFTGTNFYSDEGGFNWPRPAEFYFHKNYAVVMEKNQNNGASWMMLYCYLKNVDGTYSWKRTYITPSTSNRQGTVCHELQVTDNNHKFNNSTINYAKWFRAPDGGNIFALKVLCQDRHFFVLGEGATKDWVWDFRWEGDETGPDESGTGWVSKIQGDEDQGVGRDYNCQGYYLNRRYHSRATEAVAFPEFVAFVTDGEVVNGQSCQLLWAFCNNPENGVSDAIKIDDTYGFSNKKFFAGANGYFSLYSKSNKQHLEIGERYHQRFGTVFYVKSVQSVTIDDAMNNQLTTNYLYRSSDDVSGKSFFDLYKGNGIFNFVTTTSGNGSLTGKTTTEFCLDSTLGIFGQVYAVSQHSANAPETEPDDTVRISGFMMELDGYTPKPGWVGIGLDGGAPSMSSKVKIDPETGYFSTKLNNSSHLSFCLHHIVTSDISIYQPVLWMTYTNSTWSIDYAGRVGAQKNISIEYRRINNWQNIKINFGNYDNHPYAKWNEIRRPNALSASYSFYGKKMKNLGINQDAILPRSVRNVTIKNNLLNISATPFDYYDEHNNMPTLSYTVNPNGTLLATKTIYAHDKYFGTVMNPGMDPDGNNMLVQSAGTVTCILPKSNVVEWETDASYTFNPGQTATIQLLNNNILSTVKSGDKIVIVATVKLAVDNNDPSQVFTVLKNNTASSYQYPLNGTNPSVLSFEVYGTNEIIINSLQLGLENIDFPTTVLKVQCYVYKKLTLSNSTTVAATATRWAKSSSKTWNNNENPFWAAETSFVWNVEMNSGGLPSNTFNDFNYANAISNLSSNWKITSTVEKYSSFGTPTQVYVPGKGTNCTIYGTQHHIPIAAVSNSSFTECGVFTGDHKVGALPNYWDYENAWIKGSTNTVELVGGVNTHFGDSVIHVVKDYAACRNNRVYPGKAYIMTAWVKVNSGTIKMAANFHFANANHENDWPATQITPVTAPAAIYATPITYSDCNGTWKLMTMQIPVSATSQLDPNKVWYARAWVGNDPAQASFEAYVDDIRFSPVNALVTSSYYDAKWKTPVLSVDVNNNPGLKTYFDEFGRPVKIKKMDKSNPADAVTVQSKVYHLMGDCDTPIYTKNYESGVHDWGENCGVNPSIVTGGYNSAHALKVIKPAACYAVTGQPAAPYLNKLNVYQGYYKSPAPLEVGAIALTNGGSDRPVGSCLLSATTEWTPFTVYFDLRGITNSTSVNFTFSSTTEIPVEFYIDEVKVCALYE